MTLAEGSFPRPRRDADGTHAGKAPRHAEVGDDRATDIDIRQLADVTDTAVAHRTLFPSPHPAVFMYAYITEG